VEFSSLLSPTKMVRGMLNDLGVTVNANLAIPDFLQNDTSTSTSTSTSASTSTSDGEGRGDNDVSSSPVSTSTSASRIWQWDENCTAKLGDYAIGGALAGAIFQGGQVGGASSSSSSAASTPQVVQAISPPSPSPSDSKKLSMSHSVLSGDAKQSRLRGKGKVVTLASRKRQLNQQQKLNINTSKVKQQFKAVDAVIPQAMKVRRGIMVGLIPGLGLGLFAGLIQIGVTKATEYFEALLELEQQQEEQQIRNDGASSEGSKEGNGEGVDSWTQEQEDELDAKVKNMSTEEIQKEIEALKETLGKK